MPSASDNFRKLAPRWVSVAVGSTLVADLSWLHVGRRPQFTVHLRKLAPRWSPTSVRVSPKAQKKNPA